MKDDLVELVRELRGRRAARDRPGVAALVAEDVGWHEPGDFDYSGD
jgi:hypothetical protein